MAMFLPELLSLVLIGKKTQTRRTHKREWSVGKTYKIRSNYQQKGLARILITRKYKQRIGDITQEEITKEGFKTLAEFKQAWIRIYGSWVPELEVIVYEFSLVN